MKLQSFAALTTVACALAAGPSAHLARAALVAHWSFDGCTTADVSGSGHDLVVGGNPVCGAGRFAEAWDFDGVDDYMEVLDAAFAPSAGSWTVSAWVRTDSMTGYLAVVDWYRCGAAVLCNAGDAALYGLAVSDGHPSWLVRDDASTQLSLVDAGVMIAGGSWHFLAGTLDAAGDSLHLYVDGALRLSTGGTLGPISGVGSTIPLEIGRRFASFGSDHYFPGSIDDVRVYDEALAAAAIQTLFSGQSAARKTSWGEIKARYR